MFCERCGREIPDDSQFCPNCGNTVNQGYNDMHNTAYRNLNLGSYPAMQANNQSVLKQKKSKTPVIIVGATAIVAIAAVVIAMRFLYKPYMKPIDKLYRAYNTVSNDLLYEAVTNSLYEDWDLQASHDMSPKVSYKVLNKKRIKGAELFGYSSSYGAEDCYQIVMRDRIARVSYYYDYYDDYHDDYDYYGINTFTVCKISGEWKICEVN